MKLPPRDIVLLAALFLGTSTAQAEKGMARLQGTSPGSSIEGTIHFQDTREGLKISGELSGVPPGVHAFHIHEFGSCGGAGKAAGSHYNPMNAKHGLVTQEGLRAAHAGDLGNVTADAQGRASVDALIHGVSLAGGAYTVGGRAVILHENVDDFSQPAGNAGSRIGCGPLIITGAK